jgi:hypothetical protein
MSRACLWVLLTLYWIACGALGALLVHYLM